MKLLTTASSSTWKCHNILKSKFVDAFKESIKVTTFTQEEIDIITPILQEILPFFMAITKDLQAYLDHCL